MTPRTQQLIEADKRYVWHPFTPMALWLADEPVVIEAGDGFTLIDIEGRRYIDGVSSLWCNVHGHRVEAIDRAIREQLDRIAHSTLLGLAQDRSVELAERLVRIAPPGLAKVFYSDSGATAVEIALKMAYQFWHNQGVNRPEFIALSESYHGDTIGSVSLGGMALFHGIFRPLLFKTHFVPGPHPYRFDGTADQCRQFSLDRMEAILRERAERIAAVVVEPLVQGAGGMLVHPAGFLRAVRDLTQRYDVLLIVDEVATGFGRTGRMFACEHEGVGPAGGDAGDTAGFRCVSGRGPRTQDVLPRPYVHRQRAGMCGGAGVAGFVRADRSDRVVGAEDRADRRGIEPDRRVQPCRRRATMRHDGRDRNRPRQRHPGEFPL